MDRFPQRTLLKHIRLSNCSISSVSTFPSDDIESLKLWEYPEGIRGLPLSCHSWCCHQFSSNGQTTKHVPQANPNVKLFYFFCKYLPQWCCRVTETTRPSGLTWGLPLRCPNILLSPPLALDAPRCHAGFAKTSWNMIGYDESWCIETSQFWEIARALVFINASVLHCTCDFVGILPFTLSETDVVLCVQAWERKHEDLNQLIRPVCTCLAHQNTSHALFRRELCSLNVQYDRSQRKTHINDISRK